MTWKSKLSSKYISTSLNQNNLSCQIIIIFIQSILLHRLNCSNKKELVKNKLIYVMIK